MKLNSQHQAVLLILLGGVGVSLLLASWAGLYLFLLAWTEGVLAPWDIDKTHYPSPGTWPRLLNDFFEPPPGSHLPSVLVVVGGLCATVFRFARTERRIFVLWQALLINILFLPVLFLAYFLGLALDGLWSMGTGRALLNPRFSFGYFTAACCLWLSCLTVQGFGFTRLRRNL